MHCFAGCTAETVVEALGLTLADLFPTSRTGRVSPPKIVATYDYLDEAGILLFQSVRYNPKDFRQRRPDGHGGWFWNLKDTRRVLYRLSEMLGAETVSIVEGEKDADRLWSLGFPATTAPGGAGKWREEYNPSLAGKRVVIFPDNDEPGERHAAQVARALLPCARSVKIIRLPNLPPKGDVSDWLDAGHTKEELLAIVEATPLLKVEDLRKEPPTSDKKDTAWEYVKTAPALLAYLERECGGELSPSVCLEHYQVLKPVLLRLQSEDAAAFDIALKALGKKLGIKAKTVRDDLAGLADPLATKEARELLEKSGTTRALRLAQDYQAGKLWLGVIAGKDKLLVTSDRELLTLDKIPNEFSITDNGFDLCRFSKEGIFRFLGGTEEIGSDLLNDLQTFFLRFAVFRDKRIASLLAVWTLGTYCYRVFRVFAYLALRSPDKRCGKSRVLDLLALVAFNSSSRVVHPTEAQLFRGPSRNGGTLLLDEVETLGRTDKDAYKGLLAVLNSGFEQGGSVSREEKDRLGNFHGMNYETFCPRALAGINKTTDTLEDRSIVLMMQRKLAREKTERFSPSRLEDEAQALRDRCYIWALEHAADLAAVYDQADKSFTALDSLDDRARDLWEPLVSITAVADVERGDGETTLTNELTALACALSQVRDGAAEDSTAVQVVNALGAILLQKRKEELFRNSEAVTLTPTDLASRLKEELGWEKLSTKMLATLLHPLGIYSKHTRDGERGRRYHLTEESLTELSARYGERSEEEKKAGNES